jgi:hypothetical protein
MNKHNKDVLLRTVFMLVMGFGMVGYGLNLYKLSQCDFKPPYTPDFLRVVGLLPPAGAFLGYVDLRDYR